MPPSFRETFDVGVGVVLLNSPCREKPRKREKKIKARGVLYLNPSVTRRQTLQVW
jgi:hypothetical protein